VSREKERDAVVSKTTIAGEGGGRRPIPQAPVLTQAAWGADAARLKVPSWGAWGGDGSQGSGMGKEKSAQTRRDGNPNGGKCIQGSLHNNGPWIQLG
jgi:hypothetical protein